MFVENTGQWGEGSRFQILGGPAATTWLSADAIWLTVVKATAQDPLVQSGPEQAGPQPAGQPRRTVAIRLSFPGANPTPDLEPFDRLDTTVSYFLGDDPARWRADAPVWGGVRYVNLYPGIDLELTGEAGRLIPRLVARPGADLSVVGLRVEGAKAVALDGGALRLSAAAGEVAWPLLRVEGASAAAVVQLTGAQRFDIAAPFAAGDAPSAGSHSPAPEDNPYDLLSSTFLGGGSYDQGYGIALDGSGAAYIVGKTDSSDFPTTPGAFDVSKDGWEDVFVVKLVAGSSVLEYATFLGGSGADIGWGVAVDGSGAVYVTGETYSPDFPTTAGAFDPGFNGGNVDAFVAKLNAAGTALEYSTYLGGGSGYGIDAGHGIAVDAGGAAYVTGSTYCADFPTTPGAFDTSCGGEYTDAFVAKLNAAGSALDYATCLGGSEGDPAYGIALAASGAAYVMGTTYSADFPATPGAFDTSLGGLGDAFVARLNPTGSALDYATYLGGSNADSSGSGNAIAVDAGGAAYVTGETASPDLATPGAFDTSYNADGDAFVARLDAAGSALHYATYLGGSGYDSAYGIALDRNGAAYVTGLTESLDLPVTADAFDASLGEYDYRDGFVAKLNADGSGLIYATYLGSFVDEGGWSIAVDGSRAAYVTGYTDSAGFPTTPDAFDTSWNGYLDAFMTKLAMGVRTSFWIAGRVVDGSGQGIPGVTVSAGPGGSATTDWAGDYVIGHVITGTYTLTPTKACYSFSPSTRSVTVPPDASGQDFTGTRPPGTYSISGQVTDNDGLGMPGVTILAHSSYDDFSSTTDMNGDYVICDMPGGYYGITASKPGYEFLPVQRRVFFPPDAVGQDFATKLDIGFRPNPDGYGFDNGDPGWGYYPPTINYTTEDQIRMFGRDAVCWWLAGVRCQIKPSALAWQVNANQLLNGGHCLGMSITSLRFFKGQDDPADFQAGASRAHDLSLDSIRHQIVYYHLMQFTSPARASLRDPWAPASYVLERLGEYMKDGAPDPPILGVIRYARNWGHAVTPYAVEYQGGGVWWVKVYDNNWPDDGDRHVEIDTTTNEWSYTLWPGETWSDQVGGIMVRRISPFSGLQSAPWGRSARALNEAAPGQVWLTGPGHLLITDAEGRRIGYDGAEFVNEVPGAYENSVFGGLGVGMEPIYTLPLTQTYTILLDGQTLTQTESVNLTQFGPGYAASAEGVALQPGSQDNIVIAGDGTSLDYSADQTKQVALALALDGESESYGLQVAGADIGAGQVVTLSADVMHSQLIYSNAQADGGAYDLKVTRVSEAGTRQFLHRDIAILATDTHYAGYGAWDGFGFMTLHIDHGSDGDIDETLTLENQTSRIYLPLVVKNN